VRSGTSCNGREHSPGPRHSGPSPGRRGTRERVLASTDEADPAWLTVEVTDLRNLRDLPPADPIYAGYSLPYVGADHFHPVWRLIRTRLRPGAWPAVNLFGERDSWSGSHDEVFLDVSAARALFDGLDVLRFTEVEEDGPTYSGTKHWHTFDVIARKPHFDAIPETHLAALLPEPDAARARRPRPSAASSGPERLAKLRSRPGGLVTHRTRARQPGREAHATRA
jgi:hypothetical protein